MSLCLAPHCFADCGRIVSLAPSITETLYLLNLGPQIVGVSQFDSYPPEVESIPKVGGLLDPSLETILSLRPSVVIGLSEHQPIAQKLAALGLQTKLVDNRSIPKILQAIREIGSYCDQETGAITLVSRLHTRLEELRKNIPGAPPKKVLVIVSRKYESSTLRELYISGDDGYYTSALEYAGGKNLTVGNSRLLGVEGLLRLSPEYIIEILPPGILKGLSRDKLLAPYRQFPEIPAVKNSKILFLDEDWASVPGPRFVSLIEAFQRYLFEN